VAEKEICRCQPLADYPEPHPQSAAGTSRRQ
jgi:hypothetical protein